MTSKINQEFQMADRIKEDVLAAIESSMEKEGISQGEVARRIGALRSNINKIMRRKHQVTLDFLLKMAESIGLDVEVKVKKARN